MRCRKIIKMESEKESLGKFADFHNQTSSSDDSSSDEDEKARLKEAVEGSLIQNVNTKNNENSPLCGERNYGKTKCLLKKSLRSSFQDDVSGGEILQTTPEFRNFVAKQLSEHLESLISESKVKQAKGANTEKPNSPKCSDTGIKLFESSSSRLLIKDGCMSVIGRNRRSKKSKSPSESSDSEIERQRLSEAAISADFIIANSSTIQNTENHSTKERSENEVMDIKKEKRKKKKKKRIKIEKDCDCRDNSMLEIEDTKNQKNKVNNEIGIEIVCENKRKKKKIKKKK